MKHTFVDYVKWRGDRSFAEEELNYIDSLILCHIAYIDFSNVLDQEETITLREAVERLHQKDDVRILMVDHDPKHIENVDVYAQSKRFGEIRIANYVDLLDEEVQFSAMTLQLTDDTYYLAYRGTDASVSGWKEDFMLSFTQVPSQMLAVSYADNIIDDQHHYYLGGHSKGGNLALYAGIMLSEEKFSRIRKVFVLDGPGLSSDVVSLATLERRKNYFVSIVPEYSIIGQIFLPDIPESYIVSSNFFSVMQHSLASWQLNYTQLDVVSKLDGQADFLSRKLNGWLKDKDMLEREKLVNDIFGFLDEAGVKAVDDIDAKTWRRMFTILTGNVKDSFDETRKQLLEKLQKTTATVSQSFNDTKNSLKATLDETADKLQNRFHGLIRDDKDS